MDERKYFNEILDGLRNLLQLQKIKKEISKLEKQLQEKEIELQQLQENDAYYNDIAEQGLILVRAGKFSKYEYIPDDIKKEFVELTSQIIQNQLS